MGGRVPIISGQKRKKFRSGLQIVSNDILVLAINGLLLHYSLLSFLTMVKEILSVGRAANDILFFSLVWRHHQRYGYT